MTTFDFRKSPYVDCPAAAGVETSSASPRREPLTFSVSIEIVINAGAINADAINAGAINASASLVLREHFASASLEQYGTHSSRVLRRGRRARALALPQAVGLLKHFRRIRVLRDICADMTNPTK